jgi:membrane protein YdbS with pleckstrin-like domain
MSYLQSVLQPGERLLYESRISWTTFISGLLVLVAAIAAYLILWFLIPSATWPAIAIGLILLALSLFMLFLAWFERWTTEIAITDRRIILKRGFIRRDTAEMHMEKVESVDVNQSFFGRLLDYGDVTVRGTGAGLETLRQIDAPLDFRSHVKTHGNTAVTPH